MNDFTFLKTRVSGFDKWVVSAPRRAKRPDVANGAEPVCPFCLGREQDEREVYRVPPSSDPGRDAGWQIRVLANKFPFAPIHEVIIHSPDHHKNFDVLLLTHVELILQTYRHRYNEHSHRGQVYIFHNRGEAAGESLPHPHTQLAVIPDDVKTEIPRLGSTGRIYEGSFSEKTGTYPTFSDSKEQVYETNHFLLFCPMTSQWPDEVWAAPKKQGRVFGEITDDEISDFALVIASLVKILSLRHGHEFPFNFYIYPGGDWYFRIIPRLKRLGGFEVGTGIFVNTQSPQETIEFISEHFKNPNIEKILKEHQAEYHRSV